MMVLPSKIIAYKVFLLVAIVVLCFVSKLRPVGCARILAVETMAGKSHWNFMSGVIRPLLDNGHSVTVFTPYENDAHSGNYTKINTSDILKPVLSIDNLEVWMKKYSTPFGHIYTYVNMSRNFCNSIYENDAMKTVFDSSDFDVVLVEPFMSDCVSYIAHRLKLPLIYILPYSANSIFKHYIDGHFTNPAIESNIFTNFVVPEMFFQRFTNTFISVYIVIATQYWNFLFKLTDTKDYDLVNPVYPSLIFVNSHFISAKPVPITANVINIGGIHLNEPAKKLPEVCTAYKI